MTNPRVAGENYDKGITPAETAARQDREGEKFKNSPEEEQQNPDSIDTTGGYTVDKEGLANNYAIEPEMYVETPGDLREENAEMQSERSDELGGVNEDQRGKLGDGRDDRGRGTGVI